MTLKSIEELDDQIKQNIQQLNAYHQLVDRTITKEFELIKQNNVLKELRKTLEVDGS